MNFFRKLNERTVVNFMPHLVCVDSDGDCSRGGEEAAVVALAGDAS